MNRNYTSSSHFLFIRRGDKRPDRTSGKEQKMKGDGGVVGGDGEKYIKKGMGRKRREPRDKKRKGMEARKEGREAMRRRGRSFVNHDSCRLINS